MCFDKKTWFLQYITSTINAELTTWHFKIKRLEYLTNYVAYVRVMHNDE